MPSSQDDTGDTGDAEHEPPDGTPARDDNSGVAPDPGPDPVAGDHPMLANGLFT